MTVSQPVRHSWDLTPLEASALQAELAPLVRSRRFRGELKLAAGADAAYLPELNLAVAAAVLYDAKNRRVVERAEAMVESRFPYRTGLLSFREAPVLLAALARLKGKPQVYLFDGQGRAHPKGLGLATHLGLWLGRPTVGCAKTRLVGRYGPVGSEAGDFSPLVSGGKEVGAVVRTRAGVKPVFISPGHLMDIPGAISVVLAVLAGYRQPEPLRLAHQQANQLRAAVRNDPEAFRKELGSARGRTSSV
ncbi:MAG: endonuclease V [Thermodesulfobacteriota bacterium]